MKKLLDQVKKWLADAKAGKEVPEADLTAALVLTPEDVTAYLDTAEGAKILQPRLDSFFTKGLKTWQEKSFPEVLETEIKKRFPGETEEQKRLRKLEADLETEKKGRNREALKNKALSILTTKGLPVDLVDHFIGDDEKATLDNLSLYEKVWTEKLQAAVDVKLKETGREPQNKGDKIAKTFTKEQMKDPKFVNDNWADVQVAMAAGTIK